MASIMGVPTGAPNLTKELQKSGIVWKLNTSYSREYLVLADRLDEPQESILAAVPAVGDVTHVPAIGAKEGKMMCKSVNVTEVEVVHHPATGELTSLNKIVCQFDSDVKLDPLELDAEVRWSSESEEEALWKDVVTGAPIATAVGEQIPMTRPLVIPVLEIKRYAPFPFNPTTIIEYTNTLNEKTFWGAPAKHALLASIECDYVDVELYDGVKQKFAHVSFRIKFRFDANTEEPWKARPLHYGNYAFELGSDADDQEIKCKQITDKSGRPIQGNLDANGFELGANDDPVFLEFNLYATKDFDDLGINRTQLGY